MEGELYWDKWAKKRAMEVKLYWVKWGMTGTAVGPAEEQINRKTERSKEDEEGDEYSAGRSKARNKSTDKLGGDA